MHLYIHFHRLVRIYGKYVRCVCILCNRRWFDLMLDSTAKTNKIKIYDIFITDLHELDISLHTPLPRAGVDPASINVAILLKIKKKIVFTSTNELLWLVLFSTFHLRHFFLTNAQWPFRQRKINEILILLRNTRIETMKSTIMRMMCVLSKAKLRQ